MTQIKSLNKKIVANTPIQFGDSVIPAQILVNEYNDLSLKIQMPKTGRSHYYSLLNQLDDSFDHQYPQWATALHQQDRGLKKPRQKVQIANHCIGLFRHIYPGVYFKF